MIVLITNVLFMIVLERLAGIVCLHKVADFGLSRSLVAADTDGGGGEGGHSSDYYRSTSGILPVRWTAPEGLASQKFSVKSDVWSYAITCVEIFQDGEQPFPMVKSNPEIMQFVMAGGIHGQFCGPP